MNRPEKIRPNSFFNCGSDGRRMIKVKDTLHYIGLVRIQILHKPHKHNKFLAILSDLKSGKAKTLELLRGMSILYAGHCDLVHDFNKFLTTGYRPVVYKTSNTSNTANSQNISNAACASSFTEGRSSMHKHSESLYLGDGLCAAREEHQFQRNNSEANLSRAIHLQRGYAPRAYTRDTGIHTAASNVVDIAASHNRTPPWWDTSMNSPKFESDQSLQSVGCSARFSAVETVKTIKFEKAIRFINNVKNRFGARHVIFKTFHSAPVGGWWRWWWW